MSVQSGRQAPSDPIGYSLLLAAAVHAVLITSLSFLPQTDTSQERVPQSLKVVLVRPAKTPVERVDDPQLLAQVNQNGSGAPQETLTTDLPAPETPVQEASSPPPAPPAADPAQPAQPIAAEVPPPAPPAPEEPAPIAVQDTPATRQETPAPPRPEPVQSPRKPASRPTQKRLKAAPTPPAPPVKRRVSAAQLLASRGSEIARLTSEIDRKSAVYSMLPRRKAISAATTEYKYAAYMEAWRRKVERIGNLNYPDEARRKRLYGNLLLHVVVRADGSVERIRLLKSSGHKLLDDAAINIVKLAGPFAPFPPDIRKEVDVLDITRTWQFLSSNRLGWK